jgi:hypothetical protein
MSKDSIALSVMDLIVFKDSPCVILSFVGHVG